MDFDHLTDDQLEHDMLVLHKELFYIEEDYRGSLIYKAKIERLYAIEDALDMRKRNQRKNERRQA